MKQDCKKEEGEGDQNQTSNQRRVTVPKPTEHPPCSRSCEQASNRWTQSSLEVLQPCVSRGPGCHSDFHLFKSKTQSAWQRDAKKSGDERVVHLQRPWPRVAGHMSSWPCWEPAGGQTSGILVSICFRRTLQKCGLGLPGTKQPCPTSGITPQPVLDPSRGHCGTQNSYGSIIPC